MIQVGFLIPNKTVVLCWTWSVQLEVAPTKNHFLRNSKCQQTPVYVLGNTVI